MQNWKASKNYFWEEAPVFRLLLPLIIGIFCYDQDARIIPSNFILPTIGISFPLMISLHSLRANKNWLQFVRFLVAASFFFLLGHISAYFTDIRNDKNWFGNYISSHGAFIAKVEEPPTEKDRTWKINVSIISASKNERLVATKGQALIYVYKNEKTVNLSKGDIIVLPSKWQAIKNPGNPNEFNYACFAQRQNLFYQQFLSISEILFYKRDFQNKSTFIEHLHTYAMQQIERCVKDKNVLGVLQSMLVGDKTNLDQDLRQSYAETGIVHIIAISGTHVGIFFFLVSGLLFWLKNKRQHLKYLLAIPLIWLYVLVAGAPTSSIRAAVMFSMLGIGLSFQKNNNPLNTLFAAAFIMLLFEPMWLFSVGFQLSFTAVLSLILFFKPVKKLITPGNKLLNNLWTIIAASVSAEILIAPLVIYYFHLLPATFIFANVFAHVFMFVVLVGGLLIVLLGKSIFLSKIIAVIITFIVSAFNGLIHFLQQFNPVALKHLHYSGAELVLIYVIVGSASIYLIKKQKPALFVAFSGLSILMIISIFTDWRSLKQEKLIVYNVSKINHVEMIRGKSYSELTETTDTSVEKNKTFATKEAHIINGAWHSEKVIERELLVIADKRMLILRQPIQFDTAIFPVDYVLIDYPVNEFNADKMERLFRFKKLILGSNQKRYIVERWRDSCSKHNIQIHATQFDGAFTLN